MNGVWILIEGAGPDPQSKRLLRQGFDALFAEQKDKARAKKMRWRSEMCEGRDQAFKRFRRATRDAAEGETVVLLVDAEAAVADSSEAGRAAHLNARDKWDLSGLRPDHIHLMTQCVEAWIVADSEALASYYGQGFVATALPKRTPLDDEPKPDIYAALRKATGKTQKGEYGKVRHASDLLTRISPGTVASRCQSFADFTTWLDAAITKSNA